MVTSIFMLAGFLVVFCSPGLIAMAMDERRAKQNEAAQ